MSQLVQKVATRPKKQQQKNHMLGWVELGPDGLGPVRLGLAESVRVRSNWAMLGQIGLVQVWFGWVGLVKLGQFGSSRVALSFVR